MVCHISWECFKARTGNLVLSRCSSCLCQPIPDLKMCSIRENRWQLMHLQNAVLCVLVGNLLKVQQIKLCKTDKCWYRYRSLPPLSLPPGHCFVSFVAVHKQMGNVPISEKHLQWYTHGLQTTLHIVAYIASHFNTDGKRLHGTLKQRCPDTINAGYEKCPVEPGWCICSHKMVLVDPKSSNFPAPAGKVLLLLLIFFRQWIRQCLRLLVIIPWYM